MQKNQEEGEEQEAGSYIAHNRYLSIIDSEEIIFGFWTPVIKPAETR